MEGIACPGDQVKFTCVATNILSWLDKDGNSLGTAYVAGSALIGDGQSDMNIIFNLTNNSMNVLTSTAITNASENCVTLQCTDTSGNTDLMTVDTRSGKFVLSLAMISMCHIIIMWLLLLYLYM